MRYRLWEVGVGVDLYSLNADDCNALIVVMYLLFDRNLIFFG